MTLKIKMLPGLADESKHFLLSSSQSFSHKGEIVFTLNKISTTVKKYFHKIRTSLLISKNMDLQKQMWN